MGLWPVGMQLVLQDACLARIAFASDDRVHTVGRISFCMASLHPVQRSQPALTRFARCLAAGHRGCVKMPVIPNTMLHVAQGQRLQRSRSERVHDGIGPCPHPFVFFTQGYGAAKATVRGTRVEFEQKCALVSAAARYVDWHHCKSLSPRSTMRQGRYDPMRPKAVDCQFGCHGASIRMVIALNRHYDKVSSGCGGNIASGES